MNSKNPQQEQRLYMKECASMCGFVSLFTDYPLMTNHRISGLRKMTQQIAHRGPDQQGRMVDQHIYLGFQRLSIIDVENGRQPFSYDDGRYTIVFNGEIYNHIELRNQLSLEGAVFTTHSDTEVILALYKVHGPNAVHFLRGMFAFVIWDSQDQMLFAARDPFGIKPFYYMETDDSLYCASEMKSLMGAQPPSPRINMGALHHYFTFQYVPEPDTLVHAIAILPPGHTLTRKKGEKALVHAYEKIRFTPVKVPLNERLKDIRRVLEDSVSIHMRSDVPVGTFLSGGIDSTIIAALAKEQHPAIKSFTVGFESEGYSEIHLARQTAAALGIENISKVISAQEFVEELPRIIWHMDTPVADPAAVPLYFVAREAAKQVKVVLSGEGADELFGGYNIYREPQSLQLFQYAPSAIKDILYRASMLLPDGVKGKSFIQRGCTPLEERYVGNANIFAHDEKQLFLWNYQHDLRPQGITEPYFQDVSGLDDVTKMQYIDIQTWLRGDILVKADRMTMAHSLEARVPFLDKKVMEIARELTWDEKIHNKTTKYALREAFKGLIPEPVVDRKKLGFPVPIRLWLKDVLYDWARELILDSETDHYINKHSVLQMLERHREGIADNSRKLWTVLVFMIWHQIYVEEKYSFKHDKGNKHRHLTAVRRIS